jgi:hypothetical protein
VLAAEHLFRLSGLDLLLEIVERPAQIVDDILAVVRPFEQDDEIIAALPQAVTQRAVVIETAAALHDGLGFGRVIPEIGVGYLRFDLGELFVEAGSFKDTSAVPPLAGSGRRNVDRNRPG